MDASSVPALFADVWGVNAGTDYIRSIPTTTSDPNAASLDLGFPPNTATAVAAGGSPPDMRDFNGVLNQLTAWAQWQSIGGPNYYNSTQSSAIGGYPAGTILSNVSTIGSYWISSVDNNTSDPDSSGANWIAATFVGLGTAAYKAATDNAQPKVASVSGSVTSGHLVIFADSNGTIQDGGPTATLGTAASKTASNNSDSNVASVNGGTTIGQFADFSDGAGTVHSSGYGPGSFDAAGTAVTQLALALLKSANLSDLLNAAIARGNLGLGSAAIKNSSGGGGNVAGVQSAVTGNVPVFTDANGTVGDSGVAPGSIPSIVLNAAGGYCYIGPFLVQWGNVSLPTGNGDTVFFPITFPTGLLGLSMVSSGGEGTFGSSWSTPSSTTFLAWSFNRHFSGNPHPGPISYIAVGY